MREFEDNDDVRVMLLLQRTSAAGLTLVCMSRSLSCRHAFMHARIKLAFPLCSIPCIAAAKMA